MIEQLAAAFDRLGAALLFVAGVAMIVLAAMIADRESLSVALAGLGSGLMALAVILPRLVGRLRLSVQGLEAELAAAVEAEAEAKGLPNRVTSRALDLARSDTAAVVREWVSEVLESAADEDIGGVVEIDVERFREALKDPRVQSLLTDGQSYEQRAAKREIQS